MNPLSGSPALALLLLWAAMALGSNEPGDAACRETVEVSPGGLDRALAEVCPGAELRLEPGVHQGGLRIDRPLTLRGEQEAIIDGGGSGHVLEISAPDVTVQGLTIRNGGADLTERDSAVFVLREARGVRLEDNRIEARGFGIWLDGAPDALLAGNRISGDTRLRSQDRGNGIHLYNVSGALVVENRVWETRDGIYIDVSNGNRLIGNTLHSQRYGIHYMFSHDNAVIGNRSHGNRTGFALMQSRNLEVIGNRSEGDEGYGFLLNYLTDSRIEDNYAIETRQGTNPGTGTAISGAEGKAMFIYNAQFNEVRGNVLARTDIGIHLTAGSEGNRINENALIGNRTQVKYVATREQEWSVDGRGNYWSDYMGWDMDADGVGDVAHEPNDAVDRIFWTYPMARLLMNSPAVQLLRWVQRSFPVLRPAGVTDSAPLMRPPRPVGEAR